MISPVDKVQTEKYKQMLGLTNILNISNISILQARVTMQGGLYVSGKSIFYLNTTILGSLTATNNLLISGDVSVKSNLYGSSAIMQDISVINDISVDNCNVNSNFKSNNLIGDNLACNTLNALEECIIKNNLHTTHIKEINNTLNIYSPIINFGNIDSTVNLLGTTTYVATNEVKIYDKLISINSKYLPNSQIISPSYSPNGGNCGINIWSSSGLGYIKTSEDGSLFILKVPNDDKIKSLATVDSNNDLLVPGVTNLYSPVTILSSLNVNGSTLLNGNTEFIQSLLASGNSIFNNNVLINSNLLISGDTIINNNVTILSFCNVNGEGYFNGDTTIASSLSINGNTNITGSITILSKLDILGSTLLGGIATIGSKLFVGDTSVLNGLTTINSSLSVSKFTNIYGTVTVMNNLNVSNTTSLQGTTTIGSNLTINGGIIINGDMTIGSILAYNRNDYTNYSTLYILSKIISQLPDYLTNQDAINGGVPLWGFYRTGGILKVRLEDSPIVLELIDHRIKINYTSYYTEPGINVYSNSINIIPYLAYITNVQSTIHIDINTPVYPNTLITSTSILPIGNYILHYSGTDSSGNNGYITRDLTIINNINTSRFNVNNIVQSWTISGQPYTIDNIGLTSGNNASWALSTLYLQDQVVTYNGSWSVILKFRVNNWNNGFQINIDPSFLSWSQGNLLTDTIDCGLTNITFDTSYFVTLDSYWDGLTLVTTSDNFFNSLTNDIYLIISRNDNTSCITISFYDYDGVLIDTKTSYPFIYTRFNSLFSFTVSADITWYYGFVLHKIDTNTNIIEFQFT